MELCSGLQVIAFWSCNKDFDITWWVFNLYLMIYPLFFIRLFISGEKQGNIHNKE
ncbi:DUF5360 family protein [Paenibacillus glacialis]|uniref:DUF5360 family protein n=1 Tax=Paenibacillus glacialis TaxID=494026 RepID=UPI001372ABF3|nr:DUF5360 family protein [Paenibacillus glacialis]